MSTHDSKRFPRELISFNSWLRQKHMILIRLMILFRVMLKFVIFRNRLGCICTQNAFPMLRPFRCRFVILEYLILISQLEQLHGEMNQLKSQSKCFSQKWNSTYGSYMVELNIWLIHVDIGSNQLMTQMENHSIRITSEPTTSRALPNPCPCLLCYDLVHQSHNDMWPWQR